MRKANKYLLATAFGAALGAFLAVEAPKLRPRLRAMEERMKLRCRNRMETLGMPLKAEPDVEEVEETLR